MPKVSVIVPVYNVEEYLERCLDSLVNQTLKDIEIIIVNDGSTDGSKEKIQKYIKEIKKRKMIKNIRVRNIKQLVKKILLKINIKLYLKVR